MQVIEAPHKGSGFFSQSIFLAGGITNCSDWQNIVCDHLRDLDVVIFNPRRKKFPTKRKAIVEQIRWEHNRLRVARKIAFWFAPETVCPITLFELGAALGRRHCQKLIVGVHPKYPRLLDVAEQCALENQLVWPDFNQFILELRKEILASDWD